MNEKILEEILQELKDMHFHLDRLDAFCVVTNKIGIEKKEIVKWSKGKK